MTRDEVGMVGALVVLAILADMLRAHLRDGDLWDRLGADGPKPEG